jgi:hypothetical protein
MTEILALFKIVPRWCWAILLAVVALLGAELHGRHAVQVKWNAAIATEKAANDLLVDKRREDNRALAAKQLLDSANIQRKHDEEIATARLAAARRERVRIGTALCPVAGPTEAGGAGGGDGADSGARLVREDIDRDIRALEVRVEEAFAAGRAAQALIRTIGFAP